MTTPAEQSIIDTNAIVQECMLRNTAAQERMAHSAHLQALILASERGGVGTMAEARTALDKEREIWDALETEQPSS